MIVCGKSSVFYYKKNFIFISKDGVSKVKLNETYNILDITINSGGVDIKVKEPINDSKRKIKDYLIKQINKIVYNINNFTNKKLILFGIGFRAWVSKTKDKSSVIVLKIGFSRDILINIPKDIKVIILKPTLILLKSFDNYKVSQFMFYIRSLKIPDVYKGKGIQLLNENIKIKPGKQN